MLTSLLLLCPSESYFVFVHVCDVCKLLCHQYRTPFIFVY